MTDIYRYLVTMLAVPIYVDPSKIDTQDAARPAPYLKLNRREKERRKDSLPIEFSRGFNRYAGHKVFRIGEAFF